MDHVTEGKSQGATTTTNHNGTLETKMPQVTNGTSSLHAFKSHQNGTHLSKEDAAGNRQNGVVSVNGDVLEDEEDGGQLLKAVLKLVLQERLITGIERGSPVVEFKQPDELMVGVLYSRIYRCVVSVFSVIFFLVSLHGRNLL